MLSIVYNYSGQILAMAGNNCTQSSAASPFGSFELGPFEITTGTVLQYQYSDNAPTAAQNANFQYQYIDNGNTAGYNWIPVTEIPWQQWQSIDPEQQKKLDKKLEIARTRGRELLSKFLSPFELDALYDYEGIWIDSELHSDRKYLVKPDGQIRVYENGQDIGYECIHAVGDYCVEDMILAALIRIEISEAEFEKLAIFHSLPGKDSLLVCVPAS